jgi:ribosomal protein S18 acetylase RimI-like enzyme
MPVRPAGSDDKGLIRDLAIQYWGETEVECFGRTYEITTLPAWLAMSDDQVAGALSYSVEPRRLVIVMLNVHPEFQGRSAGRSLLAVAEHEARSRGIESLVVATTNDDLPALYLYQRWGFVLNSVATGLVLAHHDHEETGFAGIPVRDEIRLEKTLTRPEQGTGGPITVDDGGGGQCRTRGLA